MTQLIVASPIAADKLDWRRLYDAMQPSTKCR